MKKWLVGAVVFDIVLLLLNLWWFVDALRNNEGWWTVFWGVLVAAWSWLLDRDLARLKEYNRNQVVLALAQKAMEIAEQNAADFTKVGAEPVETPDPDWLERHMKECKMCRKFQEGE